MAFAKLEGDMSKALETAAQAGALIVEGSASQKAPYLTGTLKRSIHMETAVKTPEKAVVQVGTDVVYAAIQEFGGIIHAKNKPYLVFKTADGAWHSVESVQIPAHPYMRPALDNNIEKIKGEMKAAFAQVVKAAVK